MANSYDYEFNNTFPEQTIGPEFSPMQDFGKNGGKSFDLRKLLLALTTAAAAMAIMLSPFGFGVEDVDQDSANFVYEYEVKNDPENEVELTYRLYEGQKFLKQGPMKQGSNEMLLDDLEPDTLYYIRVYQGDKLIKTLRFRTAPEKPIDLLPGDNSPGWGGEGVQPAPITTEEPDPTKSPEPTPSPSPVPTPTPVPTPSPTPQPTPTPAPYVPEPIPATPKPIPVTPAPAPTDNPYYEPGNDPTTDPQQVAWNMKLTTSGINGDYTVSIEPDLNTDLYDFNRVGLTLKKGNSTYGSNEYTGADIGLGIFSVGTSTPGTYTLEIYLHFTNKTTGISDSVAITETAVITAAPPSIYISSLTKNPDGSVSFNAAVDEADFAGMVTNVTAWATDATQTQIFIPDEDSSDPLWFEGTISATQMQSLLASTAAVYVKVLYTSGSETLYVQSSESLTPYT